MATARGWFPLLLAPLLAGCSESSMFANKSSTTNNLKASVSQLQFENEQYKKQLAQLKADVNRSDSELARERDANGELTARLDDAKDVIRRQNGDGSAVKSSSRSDDDVPPPYTRPRATRTKAARKPPAAQISGPEFDVSGFGDKSLNEENSSRLVDPGPQSRTDDDRWIPVARAPGRSVIRE